MIIPIIASRDAFAVTGVDPVLLRNVMDRGHYTEAPPAGRGNVRYFGRDDLVALAIFNQLVGIQTNPAGAARIASEVRAIMRRREDIEFIYVIAGKDARGKPHPSIVETLPDGADELIKFRIAAYRKQSEADIARIIASKGAS